MWTHRFARITTAVLILAELAGCAAAPTSAALKPSPGSPAPMTLASSEKGVQPSSEALPVTSDDAVWGSPTAPVTVVEFSELQCPFCARVHPTIKSLQAKYGPSQLRLVFKHNPLPFHEHALPAAKVADAVRRQGGSQAFFAFLDLAFEQQMQLGDPALSEWVAKVGLDPKTVLARAELPDSLGKIQQDMALAERVGADGTPAFRINGTTLSGAQPLEEFVRIIDAELAATAELRQHGTPAEAVYPARVAANFSPPKPEPEDNSEQEDLSIWKVPVKGAPAIGPADALVTIVEFFDYQCPFCRQAELTLQALLTRYPKDLRIVLRQSPLPFHPRAIPAANLALEARAEKGEATFLKAHHRLMEDKPDQLEENKLLELGKELKLDPLRVKAALTKNTHAAELEADLDLASDLQARGTPHFFINGQRLSGAQPLEKFVTVIDARLLVANALVAAGTPRAQVYEEIMKRGKDPEPLEQKEIPLPSAENPTRGPVNAPIVIHEFADFQCPFCGRVEQTLADLQREFPNQLRFVWHDLPLSFHEHARPAAIVAREVRAQQGDAAFWKIHDWMMRDQGGAGALSAERFTQYAAELKLDTARLHAAQSDGRHDAALAQDEALARAAKINGTPAFVINGYFLSGAQPLPAFKRVVRYALAHRAAKKAPSAAPAKP